MKIAITGATGNIGSKVVNILLNQDQHELILITRNPQKLAAENSLGAKVVNGDLESANFLHQQTKGVDALFLIIPPSRETPDYRNFQNRIAHNAAVAVKKNNIGHIVLISGFGAQNSVGMGLISGLNDVEEILKKTAANLSILRPGWLMENYFQIMEEIVHSKKVHFPISSSVKVPMIASQDIAEAAVRCLNKTDFKGQEIIPLYGTQDYSFNEAAEILSVALSRDIKHEEVSSEKMKSILEQKNYGESYIEQLVQYYDAIDIGILELEHPRDDLSTTPTMLSEFAQMNLGPALQHVEQGLKKLA